MSPMPVCHFDRLQNNYVSRKPSHNLPSEIQENHAQQHGTGGNICLEIYHFQVVRGKKNQIMLFTLPLQTVSETRGNLSGIFEI